MYRALLCIVHGHLKLDLLSNEY
uniref:Uncharacterized protein n=1 Tax=Arundo donax TaxID=35708 RepID=A0A0A9G391_ARUDO